MNNFLQKAFLPKLLLLVVLLTFGGCQILRYNFGVIIDGDLHDTKDEGTETEKTFLEYFTEGDWYGDNKEYQYTIDNDGISYLDGYSYNDDGDDDMTGTFSDLVSGIGTVLTATVDTTDESITITTTIIEKPYLAYFTVGEWYGDNKEYQYTIVYGISKLGDYTFNEGSIKYEGNTISGTFGRFDEDGFGTVLTATVDTTDDSISISAEINNKTFLDYFTVGEWYGDNNKYQYTIDNDGISYLGNYSYNDNGDDGDMIGTFGKFDDDGFGTVLTATVDTTDDSISISVKANEKPFLDYFTVGCDYEDTEGASYTYIIDGNISYLGDYSYNNDGDDGDMIGTFGELDEDGTGTFLEVTIDTSSKSITITTVVVYSKPSEKLIELLIYKSHSYVESYKTKCTWYNIDNKYISFTLHYENDTIRYTYNDYSSYIAYNLTYIEGGNNYATFEGIVGNDTITVKLTEITDNDDSNNTLYHVFYIGENAYNEQTYYSAYPR